MINEPTINIVLVLDPDVDRALVQETIPPVERVNVACVLEGFDTAARAMQEAAADMLVVVCNGAHQEAAGVIRRWRVQRPDCPVVVLCDSVTDYFVDALFQLGVEDVVKLPETPERVMFTLEKAVTRQRGRQSNGPAELAPMICVLGPKGGAGRTVTATNLAVALSATGKRTALVDLDLQFGDVGLVLGLTPEPTVHDLAVSGGALDAEKLVAYLVGHETGLKALLAPVRPDQANAVSTDLMKSVYALMRASFDVVVVDTPTEFTPHVITAIDASSHACVVGTLDALSVKDMKLGLETLELMGYDPAATAVVLNRADTNVGLSRQDVEAILGREPDVLVPSDRAVPRSVNEGSPIVVSKRGSGVAAAFRSLAELYLGEPVAVEPQAATNGNGGDPGHDGSNGRRRLRLIPGRKK